MGNCADEPFVFFGFYEYDIVGVAVLSCIRSCLLWRISKTGCVENTAKDDLHDEHALPFSSPPVSDVVHDGFLHYS